MRLPEDITRLIFTYVHEPTLFCWIKQKDILITHKIESTSNFIPLIIKNPAGVNYIVKNFHQIARVTNDGPYMYYFLEYLADNPHFTTLLKKILSISVLDFCSEKSDTYNIQCITRLLESIKKSTYQYVAYTNSIYQRLIGKKYAYKWAIKRCGDLENARFESSGETERYTVYNNLLKIHEPNPELVSKYNALRKNQILKSEIELMASNPYMFDLLIDKFLIDFDKFCELRIIDKVGLNPSDKAIELLETNFFKVIKISSLKYAIATNPSAYNLIVKIITNQSYAITDKFWASLCTNPNGKVIELLKTRIEYVSPELSGNSTDEAVGILLSNPHLINYTFLSSNTDPRILPILKANYSKLDMTRLATNPVIFQTPNYFANSKLINKIENNLTSHAKKLIEHRLREITELEQI